MNHLRSVIWRNRQHAWLLLVYAFLIAVFHRWLGPGAFANGDLGYLRSDNIKYVNAPYIWKGFHDTGVYYAETPYLLINYLSSIPSLLFNVVFNTVTLKALFFYPYIFLTPLGAYMLAYRLTKNGLAGAAAALVYTLNTPILLSFAMGHIHLAIPPVLLPFAFLLIMKYMEKEGRSYVLFCLNLLLLVMCAYELRFWYLAYGWICLYVLYDLMVHRFQNWRKALAFILSTALSALLFNLYWALPTFLSSVNFQTNPLLQRAAFGNEYLSVMNAVALFHPYWTTGEVAVFTSQKIALVFFILPIMAAAGLYVGRKHKHAFFFGVLMLIGIILTKQFNYPLSFVYQLLLDKLPGFKLFRESTKFFHVIAIAYAMLTAYWIAYCWGERKRIFPSAVSFVLVAVLTAYIGLPIMKGYAKTIFTPVEPYDKDYEILNSFLVEKQSEGYFRTLYIPTGSSHARISATMPVVHFTSLHSEWYTTLERRHILGAKSLVDLFMFPEIDTILDHDAIRYVILPKKHTELENNPYYWYENKDIYKAQLDVLPYLRKITIGTEEIDVYENANYRPHIYTTENKDSLFSLEPYKKTIYSFDSPTQYTVRLTSLKSPVYLNFSEAYNPDWHIAAGKMNWLDYVLPGERMIPDIFHFQNDTHLNSFYISPDYIRKNMTPADYDVNSDGSLNVHLTIYFRPQSYFLIGLAGSVFSVIMLCLLAIYTKVKHI